MQRRRMCVSVTGERMRLFRIAPRIAVVICRRKGIRRIQLVLGIHGQHAWIVVIIVIQMNRFIDTLVEAIRIVVVTGIGAVIVVSVVIWFGQIVVCVDDGFLFDGSAAQIEQCGRWRRGGRRCGPSQR